LLDHADALGGDPVRWQLGRSFGVTGLGSLARGKVADLGSLARGR
jgi:hypothetical protein